MRDGFIKVAAATPEIKVAHCDFNAKACIALIEQAARQGVKVLTFPELVLTGSTCGDLFYQDTLIRGAEAALDQVLEAFAAFETLDERYVPADSLLREFIGGSTYHGN